MGAKPCIECGEGKPHTEFYRHPMMADGTVNVCKACHKARMKRRRLADPKVQEYDRARQRRPERRAASQRNAARWNAEHPEAYRAHYAVSNAVRDRRLLKEPCSICGATDNIHAHHRDYAQPLDVVWLCAQCHHRIHAVFPELHGHQSSRSK